MWEDITPTKCTYGPLYWCCVRKLAIFASNVIVAVGTDNLMGKYVTTSERWFLNKLDCLERMHLASTLLLENSNFLSKEKQYCQQKKSLLKHIQFHRDVETFWLHKRKFIFLRTNILITNILTLKKLSKCKLKQFVFYSFIEMIEYTCSWHKL